MEAEAVYSGSETHVDTEGSVAADKSGNDLEDMVKFLETAPAVRPISLTLSDEVVDIPDEE